MSAEYEEMEEDEGDVDRGGDVSVENLLATRALLDAVALPGVGLVANGVEPAKKLKVSADAEEERSRTHLER